MMHVYAMGYPVKSVGVLDSIVLIIHVAQDNVQGEERAIVIDALCKINIDGILMNMVAFTSVHIHSVDSIGCCRIWVKVVLDHIECQRMNTMGN